jgi:hypothetical protein
MKKLIVFFLSFSILAGEVRAQKFESPDLLIDTQLNSDWSGILVARLRRLLKNFGVQDPFKQKFEEPMIVTEALVQDYLNPSAKELLSDLGQVIGMDILNGKTQVSLHGLQYDIRGFKTELKAAEDTKDGVSISSDFSASKVRVVADKVTLSLLLPGKKSLPLINIDIINPEIVASEERLINFFAQLRIRDNQDKFNLVLEKANFENMATSLLDQGNGLNLDFAQIIVPELSIKAGPKTLKFDSKKIEKLLLSKRDAFKSLLIGQFAAILKGGMAADMLKVLNKVEFNKNYWIDSSVMQSGVKIESIKTDSLRNHLEATLTGDFCTNEKFKTFGSKCVENRVSPLAPSRITLDNHKESLNLMKDYVDRGEANIVISISEDYVNKVLFTTFDAGLWNDMFKEAGVKLGPNKMFFRMDEKNSSYGTLYLDLLYTPKKIERLAIGAKEVRFPLVLKAGLKIKQDKQVPIFVIHIADIDTSDATLLNGKPEIGVVSSVHKLRLKKKVLQAIRSETASLANKDILDLQYPELRGLGLDTVDFVSDGEGRMNALLLLKDTTGAANFEMTKD